MNGTRLLLLLLLPMASAALNMGRHPSLWTSPIVSLSIDKRRLRLASVRAFRRSQQSPFVLSKSVSRASSNNNLSTVRHLRFRASSGENQAVEGEEEKKEPANTTEKLTSSGTSNPSPFAARRISSKIASQKSQPTENGKSSVPPATTEAVAAPTTTATDSPRSAPKLVSTATPSPPNAALQPELKFSALQHGSAKEAHHNGRTPEHSHKKIRNKTREIQKAAPQHSYDAKKTQKKKKKKKKHKKRGIWGGWTPVEIRGQPLAPHSIFSLSFSFRFLLLFLVDVLNLGLHLPSKSNYHILKTIKTTTIASRFILAKIR
uniref:Uncharacterized protein n=1 Tax=Physcomitrium patens TaxID=3218 RepID=A0A2K1KVX3_PHYPA|nr:hypothetical protein PHYPA_004928 [Physcomitrium patens]